jgi:CRP-like cAMP-binding protein/flavin-dependent dehydrogenase
MNEHAVSKLFKRYPSNHVSSLILEQDSRVAVIGGGPAGSFFSYFLLDDAERNDLRIHVDIYEPRDFSQTAPTGCNMCGGVIYESLVQSLAVEGINLPPTIVQRGIEFNRLHLDIGSVQIQTPRQEKRIATTFRGSGPRGTQALEHGGLDHYLLQTAIAKGARHIHSRVNAVRWYPEDGRDPIKRRAQVKTKGAEFLTYDLLAVTAGVNTPILKRFQEMDIGYQPPQTTKLLVREYFVGESAVSKYLGPVFHAFLLDIPGLDYAALIPKGAYITVCLLSSRGNLDKGAMEAFLSNPAVKEILPPGFSPADPTCNCGPRINVMGPAKPFGDRIVFIGDSGVSRLYKDGIGAAYRAAKIAAATAVFQGVSERNFKDHYLPFCQKVDFDNRIGKLLFKSISQVQHMRFARRGVLRMVSREQQGFASPQRGMSMVMWDMLTGGAPYQEVLKRILHPAFWTRFLWNMAISLFSADGDSGEADRTTTKMTDPIRDQQDTQADTMEARELGKHYQDGEIIVRQGDVGDCMYVVQDGFVEVLFESGDQEVQLNLLGKGEFFGEMAIFEHEMRTSTVRARGPVRLLTVDHKNLLHRIHEDPSLAYRLMEVMSNRIDKLSEEVARLNQKLSQYEGGN